MNSKIIDVFCQDWNFCEVESGLDDIGTHIIIIDEF
jgi:hypothetical protein